MERKTFLNRYRVCVDQIGIPVVIRRSADEATLQADDIESGGRVAVQLESAAALGDAEREQLAAEARTAQQINHINIPILRDFGFADDQLIYVTEFLEGTTAEDWIKTKGPMPASAVLRIASQVASALGAARSHGIIHYAVHPGNIMLVPGQSAEGEWPLIKVLNLIGMAPALPLPGTNGSAFLNPADFASPEQLKDDEIDFRSEIYSLGCTLWFLLKGAPLAGGVTVMQDANGLAVPVRRLLAEMLAENPDERPFDLPVFQKKIQDCLAQIERPDVVENKSAVSTADIPAPVNEIELSPRRQHSTRERLALAAILVAIATLGALVWEQRKQGHAGEVVAPVPESSTVPLVSSSRNVDASAKGTAEEPAMLTANVAATGEKDEQSSSDNILPSEAESSEEVASETASVSMPKIEMMSSVPLNQENTEQPAPVVTSNSSSPDPGIAAMSSAQITPEDASVSTASVEMMARVPSDQEGAEQPAPFVASNSSPRDPKIAAIEAASEQLPMMTEMLPPAEGPIELEKPTTGNSPASMSLAEEEVRQNPPITSPQVAPEKISKPGHAITPTTKKKLANGKSHSPRLVARTLPRRQYAVASVGHIFPVWPDKAEDAAPASSPSPAVRRSSRHPHSGASVGHLFPVSAHGNVSDSPSPREVRRRSHTSLASGEKRRNADAN